MNLEISDHHKLVSARFNNLGISIAREGGVRDGTEALRSGIVMIRRAMALNPLDMGPRINLATYLYDLGEIDEAESLCSFVLKHDPRSMIAWQIMGAINTIRGKMGDAIDCHQRCHEIDPANGQAAWDLAAAYLRAGDWTRGLPLYERRDEILPKVGMIPNAPVWTGEKTGHLAVWPDQGYGDSINFARFLPWARERCDKLTVMVPPAILPLMHGYSRIATVQTGLDTREKYDHQIRITSLAMVYGLTPDNIPPDPGMLAAADFNGQLDSDGLKIGISWQGNTVFPGDRTRSIPFREFLPLAADPRHTLYSLQVGPAASDIYKARAQALVRDMSGLLEGEWSRTAALIKQMDLVVSSCTAIVHLAGALGVPCFVILPAFADWRWLHGRDDTPWYPSVRLFRQTKPGDWATPIARACAAIEKVHEGRAIRALLEQRLQAHIAGMDTPADRTEPDVAKAIRKILRPGDTFVDVGANAGIHTLLASEIVGEAGLVIAIEPGENVLPELRQAVEGKANVKIVDKPLWSRSKDVTFHLCADGSGGNAIWDPGKFPTNHQTRTTPQSSKLRATTLDAVCADRTLAPRLIKIDTEGTEQRILEGADFLLSGDDKPPFIIAELHEFGLNELGCSFNTLRALMAKHGYQTFQLFMDGSRPWLVSEGETPRHPNGWIINLLFSTEAEVNALWPEAPVEGKRPVFGYSVDETKVDKLAEDWAGMPDLNVDPKEWAGVIGPKSKAPSNAHAYKL